MGQPGYPGSTLPLVGTPERVVYRRPAHCHPCEASLESVEGMGYDR